MAQQDVLLADSDPNALDVKERQFDGASRYPQEQGTWGCRERLTMVGHCGPPDQASGRWATTCQRCQCFGPVTAPPSSSTSSSCSTRQPSIKART